MPPTFRNGLDASFGIPVRAPATNGRRELGFPSVDTRTPDTTDFERADAGKTARCMPRRVSTPGERRVWSETASATVGGMMFTIQAHFEQLEQAAGFLDNASPPYARLALILIDNVAEVVMYQRICHEFARDRTYSGFRTPKYSPNKRREVSQHFDAKVNFLRSDVCIIKVDDASFFKFAHSLRNQAYHKDSYQRDVIIPVARTYFAMVCRLYPHIRVPGVVSSGSQSEREFLDRHGLSDSVDLLWGGLERMCNELASERICAPKELAAALSTNLMRRIDEILGTDEETGLLEALMDGRRNSQTDIDAVLRRILFVDSYEPEPGTVQTDEQFGRAMRRWESEFEKFKPPVSVKTLRKWRETARSLASVSCPGDVAERYTSIEEALSRIEEVVHAAVQEFDEWVNNEVEGTRGK